MPNWVQNEIIIKGDSEKVLEFINYGLKNCGIEPCSDIKVGVDTLANDSFTMIGSPIKSEDGNRYDERGLLEPTKIEGLHLRTFMPMPESFLKYDTTNYAEKFPEIVKEQNEKYGCTGWYDYNLSTLGTKWDADLEVYVSEKDGKAILTMWCDTAWNPPMEWMDAMKNLFPQLRFFIGASEESDYFLFYKEVGGDIEKDFISILEERMKKYDTTDADTDWEGMEEERTNVVDSMHYELDTLVCGI